MKFKTTIAGLCDLDLHQVLYLRARPVLWPALSTVAKRNGL